MNTELELEMEQMTACACFHDCRRCSNSGDWHQHADDPCPIHPDAEVS